MGKKKSKFIVGGGAIVLAIAALIFFAVRANMVTFYTVSELQAKGQSQNVKVSGNLVRGTIQKGKNLGDPITFKIEDKTDPKKVLFVSYTGNPPDTFREPLANEPAPEVVLTGDYAPGQQSFSATDLMAKCPSKYEAKAKEEAAKGGSSTNQ